MQRHISIVLIALGFAITVTAQTGIRNVDFKNFTYEPTCAPEESKKVMVKNGSFYKEQQIEGIVDRFSFDIFGVAFGDLDGDKAGRGRGPWRLQYRRNRKLFRGLCLQNEIRKAGVDRADRGW
jgi:hypothetical protein